MSFLILIMALTTFPSSKDGDAKQLIARMEARYRAAKTLQATFLEQYEENGRVVRVESGTVYFRRPGRMRWEYEAPEKNVFLVDGKNAWFYVPADHTVTRVPAKESTDLRTPLTLLAGEMKVSRACARVWLTKEKPQNENDVVVECALRGEQGSAKSPSAGNTPENTESHDRVIFEVVPSSGDLARLVLRRSDGVNIEFRFQNWRLDPPVPEVMFHFQAPPGVAIVNGELPAEQSR